MIHTISLCTTCYKKIPAIIYPQNGQAWMSKECDQHGKTEALVEKDSAFVSNFYQPGTLGKNNSIILHITNDCNMSCPWCYYGEDNIHDFHFYDTLLREMYLPGYRWMLSGGEPTIRDDYLDFVKQGYLMGWNPSTITNMLRLGDTEFFKETLNEAFIEGNDYKFAMSMQHPKNYSEDIYNRKMAALQNIENAGLQAACMMFSIQSLDELDWIKNFYDDTKHLYSMLRIRTMFHNWKNAGEKQIYLSELHRAFLEKFEGYCPVQSKRVEQSNIYCLYMMTNEGRYVSLSSSPTVENIDYHLCSRPVFMLGPDYRCYPVPICQIVNEGIEKGWKDGYKLEV